MSDDATITFTRIGYLGVARGLEALIDGSEVRALAHKALRSVAVPLGRHSVVVKMDRCASTPLDLD